MGRRTCGPVTPAEASRSRSPATRRAYYASPVFTPDGDYVVVSRQEAIFEGNYQLWMYHRDGGKGISLTKPDSGKAAVGTGYFPGVDALGAAFGAGSRYIWYARHKGGFGYNLTFPQWQLATYDRETGKVVVQSDIYGSSMRPVLSPDGKWLVYATRYDGETGLRLRDLTNGSERWLRWPVQRDDQESAFTRDLMPGSAFTSDGKALITSYQGKLWRVEVPSGTQTAIPFRAQVEQPGGPLVKFSYPVDTGDVLVKQIRNPVSSPDGKRVAFSALDRLYVMDWPKGTPRRLTKDSVHEQVPAWSPDGKWITYVSWSDSGGALKKVRADGKGKPERLVSSLGFFDLPAWSPDGKRIVVVRQPLDLRIRERDPTGYDLAWVPANGGQLTRIAFIAPGGRPHFSRDTSRIYINDPNDGLVSMRWDGTDRRVHLKVTGYKPSVEEAKPEPAEEIRVSPDGRRAVAEAGQPDLSGRYAAGGRTGARGQCRGAQRGGGLPGQAAQPGGRRLRELVRRRQVHRVVHRPELLPVRPRRGRLRSTGSRPRRTPPGPTRCRRWRPRARPTPRPSRGPTRSPSSRPTRASGSMSPFGLRATCPAAPWCFVVRGSSP